MLTEETTNLYLLPFKDWKGAQLSRYAVEKARYYFSTLGILDYKVKKDRQGNPVCHYKLGIFAHPPEKVN
jgi:hypothetical protein